MLVFFTHTHTTQYCLDTAACGVLVLVHFEDGRVQHISTFYALCVRACMRGVLNDLQKQIYPEHSG